MEGGSIPQSTELVSWAVGGWRPRRHHGPSTAAAGHSCSSGVGTGLGDMLLQTKHRTHSGRKQCSGGTMESENLPSNLTNRV